MGQRCLEVIGRHNNTLETLDIHDTGMTTPTINNVRDCSLPLTTSITVSHSSSHQLVQGMRREGILQVLGSQALPVGVASQEEPHLPPSGNVLEMENWRPKKYDPILRTAVSTPYHLHSLHHTRMLLMCVILSIHSRPRGSQCPLHLTDRRLWRLWDLSLLLRKLHRSGGTS